MDADMMANMPPEAMTGMDAPMMANMPPEAMQGMDADMNPNLRSILGLAWDCGAVTTGPVTVPLVLSLGIGIANAAGKGGSSLSGFGVVTMASLFPILSVLLLALFVSFSITLRFLSLKTSLKYVTQKLL